MCMPACMVCMHAIVIAYGSREYRFVCHSQRKLASSFAEKMISNTSPILIPFLFHFKNLSNVD